MDATSNLASQEVFNLAREAEGLRIVGVITKCDAVQEGDEETVLNIAKTQSRNSSMAGLPSRTDRPARLEKGSPFRSDTRGSACSSPRHPESNRIR